MSSTFPAKTLREAYNAVDPTQPLPAGDARYVNCNDVRGNEDVVAQMFRTVSYSNQDTHQLFTGHRGCGKSTELLRLKARLEDAGFYVVYFAVDEYLDANDVIYTDLLLSVARRVEEDFRKDDIELTEALKTIESWFAEVVFQQNEWEQYQRQLEAEASVGVGLPRTVPFIARLLAKFTGQIKTGDEVKTEIRHKLDRQISQLIEQINSLLLQACLEARKRGKQSIVIIVDNLDRVTLKEVSPGLTSHDTLFVEHGRQLRDLRCHTIYTVPISMIYSTKATVLRNLFPDTRVLPMIKVHEPRAKGAGDSAQGLERMRGLLGHRVDLEALAEPDAITYLCRASGGHPRDLMTMVRHSIEYADESQAKPIDLPAVRRAEARLVSAFARMVPEDHFEKLARVHLTNDIQNDEDHQTMLFNQSVLEYAHDDVSAVEPVSGASTEPWHDVHPAVQKLARFRKALEDERAQSPIRA
ncbi:MAG TPA: P-loop NTPase fold protein [Blastocatellia bacterium]|nr:P-loop NTPase fold protein [Blastocatellia bacterium]